MQALEEEMQQQHKIRHLRVGLLL